MNRVNRLLRAFLLCIVAASAAIVQPDAAAQDDGNAMFGQSDLDQLLAPIALYPDDLLSNVLTAATYPLEVVQADRFVKQNPSLQGDALAMALNTQAWDQSVKSLAQFPSVLAMMDDQLTWTQELGDAFLAQPGAVMDTVQNLRATAQANGNLESNPQQTVVADGGNLEIRPYAPDVVYVPYYDPGVVYGVWWWPSQPPMFWSPPPRYRPNSFGNIGSGGIAYGGRVVVGASNFTHFRPNWGAHTISVGGNPRRGATGGVWQHDPAHRQGVAYRTVPSVNRGTFTPSSANPVSPGVAPDRVNQLRVGQEPGVQGRQPQPARPTMRQESAPNQPAPAPMPQFPHTEVMRQPPQASAPVPQYHPPLPAEPQPARAAAAAAPAAPATHNEANHGNEPRRPNNN
ncbi:MAG TPA: DUF3300 domain-containing protein [Burkholderiaceae bacterium]